MELVSNSRDILFLVLAFCILWVTIFLTWILYYVVNAVRQVNLVVKSAKAKLDAVEEIFSLIKEKITSSSTYLNLLMSGIGKVGDFMGGRKSDRKDKTSKKK
jgi:hypothetical protein